MARFTSPHLAKYNERFAIDGQPISDHAFAKCVEEICPIIEEAGRRPEFGAPTEFEVGTVLAFYYFAQSNIDLAVIEVGMGGRLDSTNVIKPLVTGLTHIDLDHQEVLGPDLVSIAREKAGIIKEKTPVVTAPAYPEVHEVLKKQAMILKSPFYTVGECITYNLIDWNTQGTTLKLGWGNQELQTYRVGLLGAHQGQNAAVAFGILKILAEKYAFNLNDNAIRQGFASAAWPGRLEYFKGDPEVIMDGGHNPDGFRGLKAAVGHLFPGQPIVALLGILENRPIEAMIQELAPMITTGIATDIPNSKGNTSERIANALRSEGITTHCRNNPMEALELGIEQAKQDGAVLLIAGSLYLIGHLRNHVIEREI